MTPTFYYFFIIFLTCYITVASVIYNLCYVLLLGNHLKRCIDNVSFRAILGLGSQARFSLKRQNVIFICIMKCKQTVNPCERFEPRSHFKGRLSLIVRVNVVLNRTMFLRPNISRTFFEQKEKVSMIIFFFFKQLSYRYVIVNSITLKSKLIYSGIQWLIKCPFCRAIVFHPFAGLFISKSCLSPHIKLMINETKNTSAN